MSCPTRLTTIASAAAGGVVALLLGTALAGHPTVARAAPPLAAPYADCWTCAPGFQLGQPAPTAVPASPGVSQLPVAPDLPAAPPPAAPQPASAPPALPQDVAAGSATECWTCGTVPATEVRDVSEAPVAEEGVLQPGLVGTWSLWIPGGFSPDPVVPGQTPTMSYVAGAASGILAINPDGTYSWDLASERTVTGAYRYSSSWSCVDCLVVSDGVERYRVGARLETGGIYLISMGPTAAIMEGARVG
jgi:hypothetical protein